VSVPLELVIIDDDSAREFQLANRNITNEAAYIQLSDNIGRSAIRNLFLKHTRYKYLLFLDCDSLITSNNFLNVYVDLLKENPALICGGRVYDNRAPGRDKILRWKYGKQKESKSQQQRQQSPYRSFMTNNFIIDRKILEAFPFDTRLEGYGHEDTLFGYTLKKKGVTVSHADNPVLNGGLENNLEYLQKTEAGIRNLIKILRFTHSDPELIDDVSLLRYYYSIRSRHLVPFFRILFKITKPFLKLFLSKGYVRLQAFDFYKLGLLMQHMHTSERNSC
jgi:glycosyltransferase involved in cell wall biosynthesis